MLLSLLLFIHHDRELDLPIRLLDSFSLPYDTNMLVLLVLFTTGFIGYFAILFNESKRKLLVTIFRYSFYGVKFPGLNRITLEKASGPPVRKNKLPSLQLKSGKAYKQDKVYKFICSDTLCDVHYILQLNIDVLS